MQSLILLDVENLKGKYNPDKVFNLDKTLKFIQKKYGRHTPIVCYVKCDSNEEFMQLKESVNKGIEFKYLIKNHFRGDPDLDVALAVDAMHAALVNKVNLIVLGSGDSDYASLLDYLEGVGIKVEIIANKASFALNLSKRASTINFLPNECFTSAKR